MENTFDTQTEGWLSVGYQASLPGLRLARKHLDSLITDIESRIGGDAFGSAQEITGTNEFPELQGANGDIHQAINSLRETLTKARAYEEAKSAGAIQYGAAGSSTNKSSSSNKKTDRGKAVRNYWASLTPAQRASKKRAMVQKRLATMRRNGTTTGRRKVHA